MKKTRYKLSTQFNSHKLTVRYKNGFAIYIIWLETCVGGT